MEIKIPDGMTLEQLDEYAVKLHNRKRRERYAQNPERNLQNRIKCAERLLIANGYTVTKGVKEL